MPLRFHLVLDLIPDIMVFNFSIQRPLFGKPLYSDFEVSKNTECIFYHHMLSIKNLLLVNKVPSAFMQICVSPVYLKLSGF